MTLAQSVDKTLSWLPRLKHRSRDWLVRLKIRFFGLWLAALCCGLVLAGAAAAQQAPQDPNALARALANPVANVASLATEIRLAAGQGSAARDWLMRLP